MTGAGLDLADRAGLNDDAPRAVFGLGDEGRRCIGSWGWPAQAIAQHTQRPHYFAASTRHT